MWDYHVTCSYTRNSMHYKMDFLTSFSVVPPQVFSHPPPFSFAPPPPSSLVHTLYACSSDDQTCMTHTTIHTHSKTDQGSPPLHQTSTENKKKNEIVSADIFHFNKPISASRPASGVPSEPTRGGTSYHWGSERTSCSWGPGYSSGYR